MCYRNHIRIRNPNFLLLHLIMTVFIAKNLHLIRAVDIGSIPAAASRTASRTASPPSIVSVLLPAIIKILILFPFQLLRRSPTPSLRRSPTPSLRPLRGPAIPFLRYCSRSRWFLRILSLIPPARRQSPSHRHPLTRISVALNLPFLLRRQPIIQPLPYIFKKPRQRLIRLTILQNKPSNNIRKLIFANTFYTGKTDQIKQF